jgi:hypothetical protein
VYGAICGVADGRIEFLCGVEVADLAHLPACRRPTTRSSSTAGPPRRRAPPGRPS